MNSLSFIVTAEQKLEEIRHNEILNKNVRIITKYMDREGRLVEIGDTFIVIQPRLGFPITIQAEPILLITWE